MVYIMALTLSEIQIIAVNTRCCAATLAADIADCRRLGIEDACTKERKLALLWLYITAMLNYDPADGTDNWIEEAELDQIVQNVYKLCDCFATGVEALGTNYLLQESQSRILQENGAGIYWE